MLKDGVIGDGRSGKDYSAAPLIKPAGEELWRMMAAILYFAFFALKDLSGEKKKRSWMDGWRKRWVVGGFEYVL